jgi:hypothetical protein
VWVCVCVCVCSNKVILQNLCAYVHFQDIMQNSLCVREICTNDLSIWQMAWKWAWSRVDTSKLGLPRNPYASMVQFCRSLAYDHKLNMELDLQSLFGLHVHCTALLMSWYPATPLPAFGLTYEGAIGQPSLVFLAGRMLELRWTSDSPFPCLLLSFCISHYRWANAIGRNISSCRKLAITW